MKKHKHYRAPLVLETLKELANMRDDGGRRFAQFVKKKLRCAVYGNLPDCYFGFEHYFSDSDPERDCYPETQVQTLTFIRNQVRKIWRGGEEGERRANEVVFAELYFCDQQPTLPRHEYSPIYLDWNRGQVDFNPFDMFQAGVYELAKHSHLAKVCARPDCPAPYFVARRIIQQYCSPDCAEWAKRETQLKYWARKGSQRRRQRRARRNRKKAPKRRKKSQERR
jgi:hypothetical protein